MRDIAAVGKVEGTRPVGPTDARITEIQEHWASLLVEGKLVPFVGAGLSCSPPSRLPLARELTLQVLEELCCEGNSRSRVLHSFFHQQQEVLGSLANLAPPEFVYQTIWNFLSQHGGHPFKDDSPPIEEPVPRVFSRLNSARPNDNHLLLAELVRCGYVRVIVTTNFDTLLEEALSAAEVPSEVTVDGEVDELPEDRVLLFKIHGCLGQRDSLTYALGQVSRGLTMGKRSLLSYLLREFAFLFVGWGDDDIDLTPVIERSIRDALWVVHEESRVQPGDWSEVTALDTKPLARLLRSGRMKALRCHATAFLRSVRDEVLKGNKREPTRVDVSAGRSETTEQVSSTTRSDTWLEATQAPERILAVTHLLSLSGFPEAAMQLIHLGIDECSDYGYPPAVRRLMHLGAALQIQQGRRTRGLETLRSLVRECGTFYPVESWIVLLTYCAAYMAEGNLEVAMPALALSYHLLIRIRSTPLKRTGEAVLGSLSAPGEEAPITILREGHFVPERFALSLHIAGSVVFLVAVMWWYRGEPKRASGSLATAEQAFRDAGSLVEAMHVAVMRLLHSGGGRWERCRVQWYRDHLQLPGCRLLCDWALTRIPQKSKLPNEDVKHVLYRFPVLPVFPDIAAAIQPPQGFDLQHDPSHRAHRVMTRELDSFFRGYIHPSKMLLDESKPLTEVLP